MTSNVQFFESLHAHDAGRCRKLHRIANSVIILDEPQAIPTKFMSPIAKCLDTLAAEYGSSIVFVTATQPAFGRDAKFIHGIAGATQILSSELLHEMRVIANARVRVHLPNWSLPARSRSHRRRPTFCRAPARQWIATKRLINGLQDIDVLPGTGPAVDCNM